MKSLISIAGWDPSAAAGVLLDIRVFERLGQRGFGVLTAVTAQSPERVNRVFPVTAGAVAGQFDGLAEGTAVGGIKVGMLATSANLIAVARILGRHAGLPRVVDPVLRSSSGALLLEKKAWPRFLEALGGKADLITPNIGEAAALTGRPVRTVSEMKAAAEKIHLRSGIPCLLKGGHLEGPITDILFDGHAFASFSHPRQPRNVRGTGCFLSSAILCYLADGRPLKEACGLGIFRTGQAIRSSVPAGKDVWVFDLSRERGRVPLPPRT
ncbi:MAG: hydroxymethylpyrimidine/phosphomethylpyrimidine kinase [Candidatus Aminicenantes bacterium]|nr:MAG: hydroxymethylpyrimidine/phosphomethylpyrimidine kinase [Candidatus Aminicenantes bacterium]